MSTGCFVPLFAARLLPATFSTTHLTSAWHTFMTDTQPGYCLLLWALLNYGCVASYEPMTTNLIQPEYIFGPPPFRGLAWRKYNSYTLQNSLQKLEWSKRIHAKPYRAAHSLTSSVPSSSFPEVSAQVSAAPFTVVLVTVLLEAVTMPESAVVAGRETTATGGKKEGVVTSFCDEVSGGSFFLQTHRLKM